jgi:type IV secretion system protein VirB6
MAAPAVFEPAYTYISGKLDVFLNDRVSSVISQVQAPLQAAMVLYIVLYGIAIWRGAISEPVMDIAVRGIKLAFIYAIAVTAANYSTYVTNPLFHVFPTALANAVDGSSGTSSPGTPFDQFMGYAWDLGNQDFQKGGTFPAINIPQLFAGVLVYATGTIAAALGFAIFLVSLVALAILITLGPIFIALILFTATRRYFFGWLSQAINYLVLYALIITVFALVLGLVSQQWNETPDDPVIASLEFSALSLLGAIFSLQVPNMAAGIAGGASAGIADFGRAAGSMIPRGSSSGTSAGANSGASRGGGVIAGRP